MCNKFSHVVLPPIIKWAGGKEKELPQIIDNLPANFINYYEPFVGGGSVYVSIPAQQSFINDKCTELINLYRYIQSGNVRFEEWITLIDSSWQGMLCYAKAQKEIVDLYKNYRENIISATDVKSFVVEYLLLHNNELMDIIPTQFIWYRDNLIDELKVNITRKLLRMRKIEQEKNILPTEDIHNNVETAFMSSLYMYFRVLYNDDELKRECPELAIALFCFIRNYSYSGMFRYNKDGEFNVPYGGIAYNSKTLSKKNTYYKSIELKSLLNRTHIYNQDFEEFFEEVTPTANDFVFLDPPYDSDFSTYAQNEFNRDDQKRLATYLCESCKAKWMLVIKYTPFIYSLYADKGLNIQFFDKQYLVSFMNRNDKKTKHLIITNY